MKKVLIILIAIITLCIVGFAGWYFVLRDPNVPTAETLKNILPFGSGDNTPRPTTPSTPLGTSSQSGAPTTNLFQVTAEPVAGAIVINKVAPGTVRLGQGNASSTVVRYADRATGHIYEADLVTLSKVKVSNQTLPKIYEAYFRSDGNAVLLRSLKDNSEVAENLSLSLTSTTSSTYLRGDIGSVVVGSGNTIFYALRDTKSIISSAFDGTETKTLFNAPFSDWRLSSAGNRLVAYTKASAYAPGYAYSVNISNGSLAKLLGPLNGLTVIPDSTGNRIVYSYAEGSKIRIFARNIANNTSTEILPATLSEKCLWSAEKAGFLICAIPINTPGAGEPDLWYRGATHFSDRIWLFDTNTDIAQVLAEPESSLNIGIDAIDLKLSSNEDYLIFTNKTDLSLWALKLESF